MKFVISSSNLKRSVSLLNSVSRFTKVITCSELSTVSSGYQYNASKPLSSKEYEKLWDEQDTKLHKSFSQEEFNFIIQHLYNFSIHIYRGYFSSRAINNSVYYNISKEILNPTKLPKTLQTSILTKFKTSSENWSIIFDNIPKLVKILEDEKSITHSDNQILLLRRNKENYINTLHLEMFTGFSRLQSDLNQNETRFFTELNSENFDLNLLKLYADLISTYYHYSTTKYPELKRTGLVLKNMIRVNHQYVDVFLLVNKKSLKKIDASIEPYLKIANTFTRQYMSQFGGLDLIHEDALIDFFQMFSYDETLWLKSSKWLLETNRENLYKSLESMLVHALIGIFINFI